MRDFEGLKSFRFQGQCHVCLFRNTRVCHVLLIMSEKTFFEPTEKKIVLSKYATTLDLSDREHYVRKLNVINKGVSYTLPDPFTLTSGWIEDPSSLPRTEYPSIYNYLINTPGPFTGEALKSYKSLEAYNYFVSGHVRSVKQHVVNDSSPVTFVKAEVLPGQRVTEAPHKAWICLKKKEGYVSCAHCTCMAGLGEACSHIAAVLFAIEAVSSAGINNDPACTSIKAIWNDYFREKVTPCSAESLDLSHPVRGRVAIKRKRLTRPRVPELPLDEQESALKSLAKILPSAAVCCKAPSDTDTASETDDEEDLFPPLPYRLARVKEGCFWLIFVNSYIYCMVFINC